MTVYIHSVLVENFNVMNINKSTSNHISEHKKKFSSFRFVGEVDSKNNK